MSVNSFKQAFDRRHALQAAHVLAIVAWVVTAFFIAAAATLGLFFILEKVGLGLDLLNPAVKTTVAAGIMYLVAFAITVGVPKTLLGRKTSLKELGLGRLPSWLDILIGPLGFIPYVILSVLLITLTVTLIPGFNLEETQDVGFNTITNHLGFILAFITLVVVAPIAEEAMFRGYLYTKLRRLSGAIGATLITSLVFGLVHMQLNVAIDVFALSIVMCTLREVTGSIWAGILLHMVKNGVAFFLLFVYPML